MHKQCIQFNIKKKAKQFNLKMSINLEQICFQRRHTDGQQAHERMLNIATYQRCVSQNYNEVTPHMGQNSHQKIIQAIIAGEGVEKREHFYTVGENVSWCTL